jgi:galactose mutarotase-like enzyme
MRDRISYAFVMPQVSSGPATSLVTLTDAGSGSMVSIAPGRGALVSSFRVAQRELLYLDAATFADATKNVRGGIPVLFPSPGKLDGDTWRHGGREGTMKQHGFARNLAWTVVRQNTSSVLLELASSEQTLAQFPWQFHATAEFTVSAARLRIAMRVANRSEASMPFGIGYHPYFHVTDKALARIDTAATRAFDNVGKQVIAFSGFDLTGHEVDLHLLDHGSNASVLHYADAASVEVTASPDFKRWVVWTLADKDFVCLEPWTSPGNALNTGQDLIELAPGQSHESWVEIAFRASVARPA